MLHNSSGAPTSRRARIGEIIAVCTGDVQMFGAWPEAEYTTDNNTAARLSRRPLRPNLLLCYLCVSRHGTQQTLLA